MREMVTPDGRLVLTDAAVAAIARAAALRCPGVAAAGRGGLPGEIRGLLLGEADAMAAGTGVEVDLDADHLRVAVDIEVVYGAHIPTVAAAVVAAVSGDLADQAGIRPKRLHVRVRGVRRARDEAGADPRRRPVAQRVRRALGPRAGGGALG